MLRTTPRKQIQSTSRPFARYGLKAVLAGLLVGAPMASVSCDTTESKEALNPEGPPMIRQILINETTTTMSGATQDRDIQLAFGQHASSLFDLDDGVVDTATIQGNQEIRIILDEQIRGNSLEEISCADGSFSRIPNGVTPDDITDCSGPIDSLQNCSVDLCIGGDGNPVGVELIENANRTGDRFVLRMIDFDPDPNVVELGAQVVCGGNAIPMDQTQSFWSPAGNQTVSSNPALGKKGLGPVIVLKTVGGIGLPADLDCTVKFHPGVVDHDGNQVCAPEGGLVENDCTAGDTTKVAFGTEAIAIDRTDIEEGDMVDIDDSGFFGVYFNANMDSVTLAAVTLTVDVGGGPQTVVGAGNPEIQEDAKTTMIFGLDDDFLPDATYVLTIGTGLHDQFGRGLAQDAVITWTTNAAPPPPDATVTDAAVTDAGVPDATPDAT